MSKRFPEANEFVEFPLTSHEIDEAINSINGEHLFVISARRYEQAHDRYEDVIRKHYGR
jgi:hypothetical protein